MSPPDARAELSQESSRSAAVRAAILEVSREAFLSAEVAGIARDSLDLPLPESQTLPPADVAAAMIEALRLTASSRVLEVGTGSGYTAAILSRLSADVYTIERIPALADLARRKLETLGYTNVHVRRGEAAIGWPDQAPFDAILVSASGSQVPRTLRDQLSVGGRLVMPIGPHRQKQTLVRITRTGEHEFLEERLGEVRTVERLGDILVEMGAISSEEVERASGLSAAKGRKIGETLHDVARLEEADLYRALAIQRGLRFGTLDGLARHVNLEVVHSVPRPFLEHNRVIPIARLGDTLTVVTCEPSAAVADLAQVFHPLAIELCLVTPTDYRRLWRAIDLMITGKPPVPEPEPPKPAPEDLSERGRPRIEAHFVSLFESLLLDAIGERASDIHLERYGDRVRVRLRIDGDLRDLDRYRLTVPDVVGIVNVIKIRADLDIAERRLPQGGRMRAKAGGRSFDLRVQTQPSLHGEHVVIRVLPQDVKLLTIEDLGFPAELAAQYRRLLDNPAGLILVVGPTGSGKSTTLYAALQILARDLSRKVITVEDPIEYALDGIQQTQVRPEIGFAFADAVRSFVREDPDVILVGEIRDQETALEAIRASQTGHLVLSTLHSNDAVDAVQRLFDLGMHPNSIASELLAVIAQRLARRICEGCRAPAKPDPAILRELFPSGAPRAFACFAGSGCTRCGGYGTHGRIAAVEYLRAGPELRRAISLHPPLEELRRRALEAGLVSMRDSALDLVARGLIPMTELPAILPAERMAAEQAGR